MKNLTSIVLVVILSGTTLFSYAQEDKIKTPEQRSVKKTEILTKKISVNSRSTIESCRNKY